MKVERLSHGYLVTVGRNTFVVTDEDLKIAREADNYRPGKQLFDQAGRWVRA